jgi:RNA polymerase sigma factor (sigma-70 family)
MESQSPTWESKFQHHPAFDDEAESAKIMRLSLDKLVPHVHYTPTPPAPERHYLYNFDVLTSEGERVLFLRLNYAKMRAHNNGYELPKAEKQKYLSIAYETRNYIADRNLRDIKAFVNKLDAAIVRDAEELNAELHVLLLRAIDGFNVGYGWKFSTYLMRSMFSHVASKKRRFRPTDSMFSLLVEPPTNGAEPLYTEDEIEKLHGFIDQLPERERDYITSFYGIGKKRENMRTISARCGFCDVTIRNWIDRGIEQLLRRFLGLK